jgi:hypothetical protein
MLSWQTVQVISVLRRRFAMICTQAGFSLRPGLFKSESLRMWWTSNRWVEPHSSHRPAMSRPISSLPLVVNSPGERSTMTACFCRRSGIPPKCATLPDSDLGVGVTVRGVAHDPGPDDLLVAGGMGVGQPFELVPFGGGQGDRAGGADRPQDALSIDDPQGTVEAAGSPAGGGARHAKGVGEDDRHARDPRVYQDLPRAAAARAREGELAAVHARYRAQFAYIEGELADGERLPLMRLRYGGSAHRWGTAIYTASSNSYDDQIWFSASTEEAFDFACDLHIGSITA